MRENPDSSITYTETPQFSEAVKCMNINMEQLGVMLEVLMVHLNLKIVREITYPVEGPVKVEYKVIPRS